MANETTDYQSKDFHGYPVWAAEMSIEGAFKRYQPVPTPQDVYEYVLRGLPIFSTLLNPALDPRALITVDVAADALASAVTDIEMDLGCNISPVTHFSPQDYWDGMLTGNFAGIRLERWPATKVVMARIKFPHAVSALPYQSYAFPSSWIVLRRNNFNLVAAAGQITPSMDLQGQMSASGFFNYMTGFSRGIYSPAAIEIVYQAGFDHDKLPSHVADLIKTWAAARMLADILPIIAPMTSVSNTLDSVTQSATSIVAQFLLQRIEALEKKKKEMAASFKKGFGRTVGYAFLGGGGG